MQPVAVDGADAPPLNRPGPMSDPESTRCAEMRPRPQPRGLARRSAGHYGILAAAAALTVARPATAQDSGEIAELRAAIADLKNDYERRIAELERRLALAEQAATEAATADVRAGAAAGRTASTPEGGSVTVGNAFNPQISVILDGGYYHDEIGGQGYAVLAEAAQPSHAGHGGPEHGHETAISNGFNLRATELAFSAAVDPYFDASAFIALESSGEVELEEVWFATRSLPSGLRLKAGKFLSDFGYLNNKHPHQWDFVDQNLAYGSLLGGHGLQDTGLQLTWLPQLPVYARFGAELLQGDQERLGTFVADAAEREQLGLSDQEDGPRLYTLFAKLAPDLSFDHALQVGASYVHSRQHQEIHDEPPFAAGLEGDAELWGLDLVYKYDNAGAYGYRDLNLQAEYLRSTKDLVVRSGDLAEVGGARTLTTDGLYVQGIYGFAPRWQVGLRYDVLGKTNEVTGGISVDFPSSDRWTSVLTWTPTEFSRLRVQYARDDIWTADGAREQFDSFWLQFLMSIGAHGAHAF
jgi:hypothetical protein